MRASRTKYVVFSRDETRASAPDRQEGKPAPANLPGCQPFYSILVSDANRPNRRSPRRRARSIESRYRSIARASQTAWPSAEECRDHSTTFGSSAKETSCFRGSAKKNGGGSEETMGCQEGG